MFEPAFDLAAVVIGTGFVVYRVLSRRLIFHFAGAILSVTTLVLALWIVIRSAVDLAGGSPVGTVDLLAKLGAIAALIWFTLFMFWPGILFSHERSGGAPSSR